MPGCVTESSAAPCDLSEVEVILSLAVAGRPWTFVPHDTEADRVAMARRVAHTTPCSVDTILGLHRYGMREEELRAAVHQHLLLGGGL
jgi:hypothetical protein